jgi:CDP-paratose 2-epimerase
LRNTATTRRLTPSPAHSRQRGSTDPRPPPLIPYDRPVLDESHGTGAPSAASRVLVTGGAGFIGGNLAVALTRRHPGWEIVAFDNLWRRGSELNVPRLEKAGVRFIEGDVRNPQDLQALEKIDALVECSAEPSVLAGIEGDLEYMFHTNLVGAFNCLELARRHGADVIFLSTSRVYPVAALEAAAYEETETRFEWLDRQSTPGISSAGVSEAFPLEGARTLYGATKLAAEHLVAEYVESFDVRAVVNRCGVVAGPWQMGKVDQGVFAYWMMSHHFGRELEYIGYGGEGKQVRDLLHVDDLIELIDRQLSDPGHWTGEVVNVGGGRDRSLSLRETTDLCRELTGREVPVRKSERTRPGDVRIYMSDCARLDAHTDWRPRHGPREIMSDLLHWIEDNEGALASLATTT